MAGNWTTDDFSDVMEGKPDKPGFYPANFESHIQAREYQQKPEFLREWMFFWFNGYHWQYNNKKGRCMMQTKIYFGLKENPNVK